MADGKRIRDEGKIPLALHVLIFIFSQFASEARHHRSFGRKYPSRAMHIRIYIAIYIRFSCTLETEGSRVGSTQGTTDNRSVGCNR